MSVRDELARLTALCEAAPTSSRALTAYREGVLLHEALPAALACLTELWRQSEMGVMREMANAGYNRAWADVRQVIAAHFPGSSHESDPRAEIKRQARTSPERCGAAAKACLLELLDIPERGPNGHLVPYTALDFRAVISRHFPTQEDGG